MEEDPPQDIDRSLLQTTPRCCLGDWMVLNGKGKRFYEKNKVLLIQFIPGKLVSKLAGLMVAK